MGPGSIFVWTLRTPNGPLSAFPFQISAVPLSKAFVNANGYTFPMLVDPEQAVHQLFGARWAPTIVIIGRKGDVAARYIGAGGESELRRHLEAAGLNQPTAPKSR